MLRTALKYGLIAAAIMTLVIIVPFWLRDPERLLEHMAWGEVVGYVTMIAAMSLIFFALREHKRRTGGVTFQGGLGMGLAVTGFAAAFFGLATSGLYVAMGPERTDAFMRAYTERSAGREAGPEEIAQALAQYEQMQSLWLNPWFQGFVMFATVAAIGVVVSLLAAWLLRDRRTSGAAETPSSAPAR